MSRARSKSIVVEVGDPFAREQPALTNAAKIARRCRARLSLFNSFMVPQPVSDTPMDSREQIIPLSAEWTSTANTRGGAQVRIRPLRPDDREREIEFINSLSEQSRYFRLFTPLKFLPPHLLDQLMDIDYDRRMALVATVERSGAEQFVGIARYAETDQPGSAELGITVTDAWQHCGIARLLMAELMRFAQWRGFRQLTGIVLPQNHRMIALAKSLGFAITYDRIDHLTRICRDLDP